MSQRNFVRDASRARRGAVGQVGGMAGLMGAMANLSDGQQVAHARGRRNPCYSVDLVGESMNRLKQVVVSEVDGYS